MWHKILGVILLLPLLFVCVYPLFIMDKEHWYAIFIFFAVILIAVCSAVGIKLLIGY